MSPTPPSAPTSPDMSASRIAALVPALRWGRSYDRKKLRFDLLAGVTGAAVAVPEDMAYAAMAGLPPQMGLYASLVSLLVYAVLGTSRQLCYGVTSALSIMVAGSLGAMAFVDADTYLAAAGFVALVSGAMALLAWVFRLGIVANFVSETVLIGFSSGAALYIGSSQLSKLFGIHGVQGNFFERIWNVVSNLGSTNGWTLAVGMVSLGLLLGLEPRFRKIPIPLVVVTLAILVMWKSDLEARGVEVAGEIAKGLPTPSLPLVPAGDIPQLLGLAFGVFLLSYVEGIGVAKTLAGRSERIDPGQELLANGVANVASGLFRGYAVGGSMSRSAVNNEAGARTPAAGAIAAIVLAIVLLFLTEPFRYLPEATLAAIVLVAVRHLFKLEAMLRIWKADRQEALAVLATFAGVLTFGMLEGILIGVGFTFLTLLRRIASPNTSVLGKQPGTDTFVDISRNPEARIDDDVLVFRANSGWFYANVPVIRERLEQEIANRAELPTLVVIDMAPAAMIDMGVATALAEIREGLEAQGISLELANVYAAVAHTIETHAPEVTPASRNESVEAIIQRRTLASSTQYRADPV